MSLPIIDESGQAAMLVVRTAYELFCAGSFEEIDAYVSNQHWAHYEHRSKRLTTKLCAGFLQKMQSSLRRARMASSFSATTKACFSISIW